MTSKITQSFWMISCKYKTLPYIALKRFSKYYLIPHKPKKPTEFYFKPISKLVQLNTNKYNQYLNSQKLRTKKLSSQELLQLKIHSYKDYTPNQPNENDQNKNLTHSVQGLEGKNYQASQFLEEDKKIHQSLNQQYFAKARQYDYKYKEPLRIMAIKAYTLFLQDQVRKNKLAKQQLQSNLNSLETISTDQSLSTKTKKKSKTKKGTQRSQQNLSSVNKLKLASKWKALTEQQKQVYINMENNIKQLNRKRIQQFIQNHQIPVKTRHSMISRFTTRYAPIHKLALKDKKLYEIYHALSDSEKQFFKQEAQQLNTDLKQKYENFLKRWNITEGILQQIIETSLEYKREKSLKIKKIRKQNIEKIKSKIGEKYDPTEEESDSEDFDTQETVKDSPKV